LRSVAYGWRQEALAENARRISETGRELHRRLTTFSNHLSKVGKSLEGSVKSYNSAVSSLESRVIPSARKFETLEASEHSLSLEDPQGIDLIPKQPRALPEPHEPDSHQETNSSEAASQSADSDLNPKQENDSPKKAEGAANDFRAALEQ